MKKLAISFMFLLVSIAAFSQNSAVDNAGLYHKEGELDRAKKEIDEAVVHEKTKSSPKAWYYKGAIYSDLYKTQNPTFKALSADPLNESVVALKKAKELDAAKGEWYKLADAKLKEIWAEVVNSGISQYESEDYRKAQSTFEMAQNIQPEDTSAYIYASYAAESLDDKEALKRYMEQLVKLNHKSVYTYRTLISLESDQTKKIELAQKAYAEFPQDPAMLEVLGDTYAETGKYQEALESYSKLNVMMPENVAVMTKMAVQHQKLNEMEKAAALYEKIVKLDKLNFIAHYNVAVIYYEKAKELDAAVHKLSMDEYHNKGKQMEEEINGLFLKAKEYASVAINQTTDEADINNIKLMLSEIEKKLKK